MPGVHADGRRDAKITTQGIKTPGGGQVEGRRGGTGTHPGASRKGKLALAPGELVLMPRNGWLRQGNEWLPWVYWGQLVHVPRGGRPVLTPEGTGACAGEAVVLAPRRGSQGITFMDVHGWCDARGFHWRASRCQGSTLKGIKAPRGDAQRRRDARGMMFEGVGTPREHTQRRQGGPGHQD